MSAPESPTLLDERILADLHADFASTDDLPELAELIRSFAQSSTEQLRALSEAVSAGDAEAIALGAHKLKGSSRTLGAHGMGAAAAKLEDAARAGDLPAAQRTLSELETVLALSHARLAELVDAIDAG